MDATRTFKRTRFPTDVIVAAVESFVSILPSESAPHYFGELTVDNGDMSWKYDSYDEFLAEHREPHDSFTFVIWGKGQGFYMRVDQATFLDTTVHVQTRDRESILKVLSVFVKHASESYVALPVKVQPAPPKPRPPRIFVGHGRDEQWRDLKDHLQRPARL